jgi:penicillin G amidase
MTINVSAYLLSRPFDPGVGPAYRQIVDCGDAAASRWIIPGGSSGDPLSPHYGDQLEDWRHGRYHPMMPDAVIAAEVLELVPCIRQRL